MAGFCEYHAHIPLQTNPPPHKHPIINDRQITIFWSTNSPKKKVSFLSIFNTIQCFLTLVFTRRVYAGAASKTNVTPLSSRLFGTWTFLSCVVRWYAAYHVDERGFYIVAFWTFAIALFHFATEWLVYGTMQFGKGIFPSLVVATTSLVWMGVQWEFYVG